MGVNLGASLSPLHLRIHRRALWMALGVWAGDDRHADWVGDLCDADARDAASDRRRRLGNRLLADRLSTGQYRSAIAINVVVALALVAAATISISALSLGGIPDDAGRPPSGKPRHLLAVLVGIVVCIPFFTLFVSDFSIVRDDGQPLRLMADETVNASKR